jgi:hypothetical protein
MGDAEVKTGTKFLRGWGTIELYTGESRKTLLRKKYPVRKDSGGSVWADAEEIDQHRVGISGNLWESLGAGTTPH